MYRNLEWVDNGQKTKKEDPIIALMDAISELDRSAVSDLLKSADEPRYAFHKFRNIPFDEDFDALRILGCAATKFSPCHTITQSNEEYLLREIHRAMDKKPIPLLYREEASKINSIRIGSHALTLLQVASANYDVEAVRYLVSNGADVNYRNHNQINALFYVAHTAIPPEKQAAGYEIAQILIDAGSTFYIRGANGEDLFNSQTDPVVAQLIKNKDPNITPGKAARKAGCYIASCVYESYDCPEVWTLRRFRDNTLDATWYGKAFIRIYYTFSPWLVKLFGKAKWFRSFWKKHLDKKVKKLNAQGFESTPYQDKNHY